MKSSTISTICPNIRIIFFSFTNKAQLISITQLNVAIALGINNKYMYMFMHQQQNNCTISIRMHYQFECKKDRKKVNTSCRVHFKKDFHVHLWVYLWFNDTVSNHCSVLPNYTENIKYSKFKKQLFPILDEKYLTGKDSYKTFKILYKNKRAQYCF